MKLPRGYTWRETLFTFGGNAAALALNLWLAHGSATEGRYGWLFFNCTGAALPIWSLWHVTRMIRRAARADRGQ